MILISRINLIVLFAAFCALSVLSASQFDNRLAAFEEISSEKILMNDEPLSMPLEVQVEDFDETLLFAISSKNSASIVSFDTKTKYFRDISGKVAGYTEKGESSMSIFPQISSDGKLIAFIKPRISWLNMPSVLYLMKSDGSEVKRLADDCNIYERFAFGPENKSILYVDHDGNLKKVKISDSSVEEIENHYRGTGKFDKIHYISFVDGYVYWLTNLYDGFEIWRKNLLVDPTTAVPELVYRAISSTFERDLTKYAVSPDGKRILIAERHNFICKYLGIFDIPQENVSNPESPMIHESPSLNYFDRLQDFFWYTDSQGQEWIYAERSGHDLSGLVRCKVDELPLLNFEMVIPGFSSFSGVSIVPKCK